MKEPEIYLFTGPEAGMKNDAIGALREAAVRRSGQVDEYKYYAADVRVQDVVAQLQNVSLFSAALFIVLRNAEQIKLKADVEALASWAKGAAGESPSTLVLVSDETGVERKVEALVPAGHKKVFWEMYENRKPQWVQDFFRRNGFGITADAVTQVLDLVENNTESLRGECSRFFYCFEPGHTVTEDDVDKILTHNREENAFTLFEALGDPSVRGARRFEGALEILQKIRLSRDSGGVMVIAGLTYCYRQLRLWHQLHAGGSSPTDAQLRASGFGSKTNRTRYQKAAQVWGPGTTTSVLSLLAATDMAIREGGSAMEDTYLVLLLYAITVKNGLYCATYEP